MRITLLNYTGTVGKTTIAAHLLSPRMGNAPILAIESINETAAGLGVSVEQFKGDKFREILRKLLVLDDVVIDVGASNVEDFLDGMVKFDESHLEVDTFVIPVTAGTKEQKETLMMIKAISDMGVSPNVIRVVFNRVKSKVEDEFPIILSFLKQNPLAIADPKAAIYENELFDILAIRKLSLANLLADETDYRVLLRNNKEATKKERDHWSDMYGLKALARHVNRNLDDVYSALFCEETAHE